MCRITVRRPAADSRRSTPECVSRPRPLRLGVPDGTRSGGRSGRLELVEELVREQRRPHRRRRAIDCRSADPSCARTGRSPVPVEHLERQADRLAPADLEAGSAKQPLEAAPGEEAEVVRGRGCRAGRSRSARARRGAAGTSGRSSARSTTHVPPGASTRRDRSRSCSGWRTCSSTSAASTTSKSSPTSWRDPSVEVGLDEAVDPLLHAVVRRRGRHPVTSWPSARRRSPSAPSAAAEVEHAARRAARAASERSARATTVLAVLELVVVGSANALARRCRSPSCGRR